MIEFYVRNYKSERNVSKSERRLKGTNILIFAFRIRTEVETLTVCFPKLRSPENYFLNYGKRPERGNTSTFNL